MDSVNAIAGGNFLELELNIDGSPGRDDVSGYPIILGKIRERDNPYERNI